MWRAPAMNSPSPNSEARFRQVARVLLETAEPIPTSRSHTNIIPFGAPRSNDTENSEVNGTSKVRRRRPGSFDPFLDADTNLLSRNEENPNFATDPEKHVVKVVDLHMADSGNCSTTSRHMNFKELQESTPPTIRIVFAEDALESLSLALHFRKLYNLPTGFMEEIVRCTESSGTRDYSYEDIRADQVRNVRVIDSWFRFICQTPEFAASDPRPTAAEWTNAFFMLRWERSEAAVDSDDESFNEKPVTNITLLCFGELTHLERRFENNLKLMGDAVKDPFALFVPVLLGLTRTSTLTNKIINAGVRDIEHDIFRRLNDSRFSVTAASAIDFTGLHIVAKRVIFARECLTAFQSSVARLAQYHNDIFPPHLSNPELPIAAQTRRYFSYIDSLISGTSLRLESDSARMQNTINLAFNSVQQEDNRAMRLFGEVSFFVIPVLFVSSIFGVQFFDVQGDNNLGVTKNFWIFWVMVVLCGAGLVWFVKWRTDVKSRLWPFKSWRR